MFVCEICKRDINTKVGLSKHVSQIHHNISLKDYYDKYIKKPGEGICPITKKPTKFKSMTQGYYKFSGKGTNSKDTNNKKKVVQTLIKNFGVDNAVKANKEQRIKTYKNTRYKQRQLKLERWKLVSILRKLTIVKGDKKQCQICGSKFKTIRSLSVHIQKLHKILMKDYYDEYFKKDGDGICLISGLETNFYSLKYGYWKYHNGYQQQSEDVIEGGKRTKLMLHGHSGYNNMEAITKTKVERYGDPNYNNFDQITQTKIENHGDPNYNNRKKYNETMSEKFGEDGFKEWKKKLIILMQDAMLEKYGVKHGLQSKEILKTVKETVYDKYKGASPMCSKEVSAKISGPNHYMWNPNREEVYKPYTKKFYDMDFRESILEDQNAMDPVSGEKLTKWSTLHHIDHNKQNDSRENMIYLNINTHRSIHAKDEEYWKGILKEVNLQIMKNTEEGIRVNLNPLLLSNHSII